MTQNEHSVHFILKRMGHHAQASGYDRLVDYVPGAVPGGRFEWTFARRAVARLCRPLIAGSGTQWYHRDGFIRELQTAGKWFAARDQIFHFLYGENSYRYLGLLRQLSHRNTIVCTYHTPEDRFMQVVKEHDHLRRADAVVTVSTVQNSFLGDIVGDDKVFFVPHGVDTEFFTPPGPRESLPQRLRCLTVGGHLRDFETLAKAQRLLSQRGTPVELAVVTSPDNHAHFQGVPDVELLSGIPDNELLQLYRRADVFLMPVLDCTANNAILEAMACGLPVIATDLQGIRDYTIPENALLTPRLDAAALAEAITRLHDDSALREQMATASRDQALVFRWENIATRLQAVYNQVS